MTKARRAGWLAREATAWGRAVRGVAIGLVVAAAALAALRFAGARGLLAALLVGWVIWWLGRLGRS